MLSAEMERNGIRFMLCQGTEEESQVSRLVSNYGLGVAHTALAVDDVHQTAESLKNRDLGFDTGAVSGLGLTQTFTFRCQNTGLCFEFIRRDGERERFEESNVQQFVDKAGAQGAC